MTWKRFEFILSWLSIGALIIAVGYVGYVRMQPQSSSNSDRQLFNLFLSSEMSPEGDDPSVIIQPNDLSEYLVPSSTQSAAIGMPLDEINLNSTEIQAATKHVSN